MNWDLLLLILGKTLETSFIETLTNIDWSQKVEPEVSKEIRAAKNNTELHAAVKKLRARVTKK